MLTSAIFSGEEHGACVGLQNGRVAVGADIVCQGGEGQEARGDCGEPSHDEAGFQTDFRMETKTTEKMD